MAPGHRSRRDRGGRRDRGVRLSERPGTTSPAASRRTRAAPGVRRARSRPHPTRIRVARSSPGAGRRPARGADRDRALAGSPGLVRSQAVDPVPARRRVDMDAVTTNPLAATPGGAPWRPRADRVRHLRARSRASPAGNRRPLPCSHRVGPSDNLLRRARPDRTRNRRRDAARNRRSRRNGIRPARGRSVWGRLVVDRPAGNHRAGARRSRSRMAARLRGDRSRPPAADPPDADPLTVALEVGALRSGLRLVAASCRRACARRSGRPRACVDDQASVRPFAWSGRRMRKP